MLSIFVIILLLSFLYRNNGSIASRGRCRNCRPDVDGMQPGPHLRFSGRQHEDQVSADVCRDAGQVEDVDRDVKDDQVVHGGHVTSGCNSK